MKTENGISLSRSKLGAVITLLAVVAGILGITAEAEAQRRGVRVNDRQVERIIRNIKEKSDTFKRSFDPALDRSRLDGTYTEDQVNQYVKSFEDATNDLRSRFNGRTAVASDVENVLNRAAVIDQFMRTNLRQRQIQANWAALRTDLNRLASAYNVMFDWNGQVLPPTVVAVQAPYRVSDRQVQTLLDRIESRGDVFRTSLDRALDRSRYNETNRERNVNEFVKDFENATDELRRKFDGRTSVDLDVSNVLVRAARIDDFMSRNLRRETAAQRSWRNLRADLNQLSTYYGLAFNLDDRRGMPAYSPLATLTIGDEQFTGTYRLDNARSENAQVVAERVTAGLNANARARIVNNLSRRLTAPEMIAMRRAGTRVLLATSLSPEVALDADGQLRNERYPNGRPSNVRAGFVGDSLSIVSNGDRANDFTATFTAIDGGRRMLVSRRVYVEQLREPVEVRSYYDRISDTAQFNIQTNSGPGYLNTGYSNSFIVPRGVTLVAALDRDLSTETARDGDRFTMTVISPGQYAGAIIEGHVSNLNRSGRIAGRSGLSLVYDTIRLNNQVHRFAGVTETVRNVAGERVQIDNEGLVEDRTSQTNKTVGRTAVGAGIGALLGAIFGGGDGAAIGAAAGAGVGVGSIYVQGRDDLQLRRGAEFAIRSTAPLSS